METATQLIRSEKQRANKSTEYLDELVKPNNSKFLGYLVCELLRVCIPGRMDDRIISNNSVRIEHSHCDVPFSNINKIICSKSAFRIFKIIPILHNYPISNSNISCCCFSTLKVNIN